MSEGGRCAHCGTRIGSYQQHGGQTTRGGRKYCSSWCASEDNPILTDGGLSQGKDDESPKGEDVDSVNPGDGSGRLDELDEESLKEYPIRATIEINALLPGETSVEQWEEHLDWYTRTQFSDVTCTVDVEVNDRDIDTDNEQET